MRSTFIFILQPCIKVYLKLENAYKHTISPWEQEITKWFIPQRFGRLGLSQKNHEHSIKNIRDFS